MSYYSFHRGFFDVLMNQTNGYPEEIRAERRMEILAGNTAMKRIFSELYTTLIQKKEIKPLECQDIEHKQELWELANRFMPDSIENEKVKFCKAIMATLWLLNN